MAAAIILVLAPFAVAIARALHDGWVPVGDNANIAVRALDVFSSHPPLTGLPSTAVLYGGTFTNHPGPIEFYLLALPVRLIGLSTGMLVGATLINAAFVLITLWVFLRRLGPRAVTVVAALLCAVLWAGGSAVLVDPVSSNMTMYSLLATFVTAWALLDGDVRVLPLATICATYAAQQHLAAGVVAAVVVCVALVGLAVQVTARKHRGDSAVVPELLRYGLIAVGIALACWAPVVWQEVTHTPGNLTAIARLAGNGSRPKLGPRRGVDQVLRALRPPTLLGRSDTTGGYLLAAPDSVAVAVGLAVVTSLVRVMAFAWRQARSVALLALVGLTVLIAGAINGSAVPQGFESLRINLYRWAYGGVFVVGAALAFGAGLVVRRRPAGRRALRVVVPVSCLIAAGAFVFATVFGSAADDHSALRHNFRVAQRVADQTLRHIDRSRPVVVVTKGYDAFLGVGPYVIARLVAAGVPVQVSGMFVADAWGPARARRSSDAPTVVIESSRARVPRRPGTVLALEPFGPGSVREVRSLGTRRTRLLDRLSAAAEGRPVILAPAAMEAASPLGAQAQRLQTALSTLRTDPASALADDDLLRFALAGGLRSPALDPETARALLRIPPVRGRTAAGADQISVRLVPAGVDPGIVATAPAQATGP